MALVGPKLVLPLARPVYCSGWSVSAPRVVAVAPGWPQNPSGAAPGPDELEEQASSIHAGSRALSPPDPLAHHFLGCNDGHTGLGSASQGSEVAAAVRDRLVPSSHASGGAHEGRTITSTEPPRQPVGRSGIHRRGWARKETML